MRIVVLAGGLSMERNVSLSSGTRICRALRARGHQAALVDLYLGLEGYDGAPESIFDAPDGLCGDFSVMRNVVQRVRDEGRKKAFSSGTEPEIQKQPPVTFRRSVCMVQPFWIDFLVSSLYDEAIINRDAFVPERIMLCTRRKTPTGR